MIRPETSADIEAIREVNRLAFGGGEEADLVDRLRAERDVMASLVAEDDGAVIGHILFSTLRIEGPAVRVNAAALAPMCVRPEWQGEGIGTALVERGLERCRERGMEAVIVLGHPEFYPRFGFRADLAAGLQAPFSGDAFMALELKPRSLDLSHARVHYARAFGLESE